MPIPSSIQSTELVIFNTSKKVKKAAPEIVGMASRKENRELAVRENPSNSAHVIVIPERDVPGMSANTWAKPMTNA